MDKILATLDKKYNEQPWLFRAFFLLLGYVVTDLAIKISKK